MVAASCHPAPPGEWRTAIERKAERRPCAICATPFAYHPKLRTTYCSRACKGRSRAVGSSCSVLYRQCPECKRQFVSHHGSLRCGLACRRARARRKFAEAFVPTPTREYRCTVCGSPLTCGVACARRLPANHEAHARRRARKAGAFVERVYRARVFERDSWRCQLCGKRLVRDEVAPHPSSPTLDHIVPLAAGGEHSYQNVQAAHFRVVHQFESAASPDSKSPRCSAARSRTRSAR